MPDLGQAHNKTVVGLNMFAGIKSLALKFLALKYLALIIPEEGQFRKGLRRHIICIVLLIFV